MRSKQIRWLTFGIAALQALAIGQAGAQSIAVNMNANGRGSSAAEASLAQTDVAGVVPQANWANLNHNGGTYDGLAENLLDSDGTPTTVSFEYIANDAWSNNSTDLTPNDRMMRGMQKCNPDDGNFTPHDNSKMTFRWGNLLPGSTFNVIVYQMHNAGQPGTAKSFTSITGGSTTYYLEQLTAFDGTFDRSTVTTQPADAAGWNAAAADYIQFDNVSPDGSGVIEIVAEKFLEDPQQADGMGVCGLQLVLVSGSWPQPADPPMITQEPADALGVVGDDITVSIGIDGPWNVEWFKNDVSVQSGLSTDYTLAATTAADKDATVYAIVSNAAGAITSTVATVTLDDPQPEQLVQGFLRGEHYGGVGGTVVFPDLYNHVPFQTRTFDYEFFSLGGAVGDTGDVDFGRVMEGWVVPPTTGSYTFFLRSDDGSELFVNPTGGPETALPPIPANFAASTPDAVESDCCDPFQEPGDAATSAPFALTGGEFYGIASLYKEAGGGDFWQLTWREAADTTPAAQLTPLGPENVYTMASPAGKRASITNQPQSVTVLQNRTATFTVGAETRPRANEFAIQWTRDGVNIPGATQASYTTDLITLADDQAVFQAKVYTLAGIVLSDAATLTVDPDATAPTVVSAGAYTGSNTVGVLFSEAMDEVSATDPLNYVVDGVNVTAVELIGNGGEAVALTVDAAPAAGATVSASGATDLAGNTIAGVATTIANPALNSTVLIRNAAVGSEDPINEGRSIPLGADAMYIEAGGGDIWNENDGGHGAYTTVTGPFRLQVRVQSLEGPDNWTKAILDVRETTDGNSRHVNVTSTRTNGQNQRSVDGRNTTGGASRSSGDDGVPRVGPVPYPNSWLRIDRVDVNSNAFDGYLSADGVNWDLHYTFVIPDPVLPATLQVGMAATAHNNGPAVPLAEAVFRDFSIQPLSVATRPILTAVGISGGNITVDWQDGGELYSAPALTGPWTGTMDTDGSYTEPVGTDGQKYFRTEPDVP